MKTTHRFVSLGIALAAIAMVLLLAKIIAAGRVHNRAHGLHGAGKRANGAPQ